MEPKLVAMPLGLGLVLDGDRDAVERAAQLAGLAQGGVEASRVGERLGADRDIGVERRPALIVGRDPVEVALDQLDGGQRAGEIGGVDLLDGRFFQGERLVACHFTLLMIVRSAALEGRALPDAIEPHAIVFTGLERAGSVPCRGQGRQR
jgi:hypothetical protein